MRFKSSIKLLVAVLLLVGAIVSLCLVISTRKARERTLAGISESRARLIEMLGSSRSLEGRLLGMTYTNFDPVRARKPLPRRLLKEALTSINSNRNDTEAERLSNEALVYSFGNELDLAIQTLTRATASKGAKPWMWSDLSALYLSRSRDGDLIRALSFSSKGLQAAESPEAMFNRALCLERLALVWAARKAWLKYLRYDSDSFWADEARLHLKNFRWPGGGLKSEEISKIREKYPLIEEEVVKDLMPQNPQAIREYGENLLGDWGHAWTLGRGGEAERLLDAARLIGKVLILRSGDPTVSKAVASIHSASAYPGRTDRLAKAHALYKQGKSLLGGLNFSQARDLFYKSDSLLSGSGSTFSGWARLHAAICDMQVFRYGPALVTLKSLATDYEPKDSASLLGMVWWSIGLINGILVRPVEALDAYRRSADLFAGFRDFENLAAAESLMATSYRDLGDKFLAWHHELEALRLLGQVHDPRRRFIILDEAGVLLRQSNNLDVALVFQNEMTAESAAACQPALIVASLRKVSELYNELGLSEKAHRILGKARSQLADINDEDARLSLAGDLLLTESSVLIDHAPKAAIEVLNSALRLSGRTNNDYQVVDLLFQRAQAHAGLGNLGIARRDLNEAICLIQRQRREIRQASLQEQFLDRVRNLFELMTMLQLRSGNSRTALGYTEYLRSNAAFVPNLDGGATEDFISHLQATIPQDTVVVNYFFLGEKAHVWLVRRSEIQDFELIVTRAEVDREVKALKRGMEHRKEGGFQGQMGVLWRQLLSGFSSRLREGERIVFVPDGPLHSVPFAALWDEERQRYLLQDHQVTTMSSAVTYVAALGRSRVLGLQLRSVLAVGDPTLDRRLWPSLDSLKGAQREAREVASLYTYSKILVGNAATIGRVEKFSSHSDVIHFASHAIIDSGQPLLSMLLLSPQRLGEQSALYARDLYSYSLPKTRIVILAACSSLGEGASQREGLSSLARPLLAIGVPAVVGSLWKIEDEGSSEFLIKFHRNLLKRSDPVEALRKTQMDSLALKGSRAAKPVIWAAFQIYGS